MSLSHPIIEKSDSTVAVPGKIVARPPTKSTRSVLVPDQLPPRGKRSCVGMLANGFLEAWVTPIVMKQIFKIVL